MPDDTPLFPNLRAVYWSVGNPRNDSLNLAAFERSPLLRSVAFDAGDVPSDPWSTQCLYSLYEYFGRYLPQVEEVTILRTDVNLNGSVPAPGLRFFRSLLRLNIQCDIQGTCIVDLGVIATLTRTFRRDHDAPRSIAAAFSRPTASGDLVAFAN